MVALCEERIRTFVPVVLDVVLICTLVLSPVISVPSLTSLRISGCIWYAETPADSPVRVTFDATVLVTTVVAL
jgi:hypothetical protein